MKKVMREVPMELPNNNAIGNPRFPIHGLALYFRNASNLLPLMLLCFIDGNLLTQAFAGLIAFHRLDMLFFNAFFSIGGFGAWLCASSLPGARIDRIKSVVLSCFLVLFGVVYCILATCALRSVVSNAIYQMFVRVGGAIAVTVIGFQIMGVRVPGGWKTPLTLIGIFIVIGIFASLLHPQSISAKSSIDVEELTLASLFMLTLGGGSVAISAWVGSNIIERYVDPHLFRFTAGVSVVSIGVLISGLSITPLILVSAGAVGCLLLKRQTSHNGMDGIKSDSMVDGRMNKTEVDRRCSILSADASLEERGG
jgi:hypothetical protein